jgi:hypothetical protein
MDPVRARQIERIREMTADQRVKLSHSLWLQAWSAAAAGVRGRNPEWSDDQVNERVRELMRDAGP